MAECVNDAGGRQGEGDGDLSCCLQRCPSDQGVGIESLLHKQLPSPEPEGSKERALSRALCPWQGVSVYIDIYIK